MFQKIEKKKEWGP
ncbi:hypothetical protein G210_0054 [Candida maltosa Xu316]|uniref:Uncharacterized protein n=1 Tax=Candida maltosa (strain Xu316) TaxID=1245528 RepID=M3K3C8_CANMX|nr:hypothetical protein G210_0054 [Candida maltosa Xu316]